MRSSVRRSSGGDRGVELRTRERFVHADHIAGGGGTDQAGARLHLQRTRQHDQDRRLAALGHRLLARGDRDRPRDRRQPPQLRRRRVREQRARLAAAARDRSARRSSSTVLQVRRQRAMDQRVAGRRGRATRSACGRCPSASSTFSDSSARNSSADSDSVIDRLGRAMTDARIGAPSSSSSTPSAAGARTSCLPSGPATVTRPSSRNCIERDRRAAFVERAARFVAHLPPEPRQPEQLVDVREVEQRHPPQAIGELDRRQRLLPQLLAALAPVTRFAASAHDAASNTS